MYHLLFFDLLCSRLYLFITGRNDDSFLILLEKSVIYSNEMVFL